MFKNFYNGFFDFKLFVILFVIVFLGFGFSFYLSDYHLFKSQGYDSTTLDIITLLALITTISMFVLKNRKKDTSFILSIKILSSIIPVAIFLNLSFLALYRIQDSKFQMDSFPFLGQGVSTSVMAFITTFLLLITLILFINFNDYFKSTTKIKNMKFFWSLTKGIMCSLILSKTFGYVMSIGKYGESVWGVTLAMYFYLIMGFTISIIITSITYYNNKKELKLSEIKYPIDLKII